MEARGLRILMIIASLSIFAIVIYTIVVLYIGSKNKDKSIDRKNRARHYMPSSDVDSKPQNSTNYFLFITTTPPSTEHDNVHTVNKSPKCISKHDELTPVSKKLRSKKKPKPKREYNSIDKQKRIFKRHVDVDTLDHNIYWSCVLKKMFPDYSDAKIEKYVRKIPADTIRQQR